MASLALHLGLVLAAAFAGSMGAAPVELVDPVVYEVALVTVADAGGSGCAQADPGPVGRVESPLPRRVREPSPPAKIEPPLKQARASAPQSPPVVVKEVAARVAEAPAHAVPKAPAVAAGDGEGREAHASRLLEASVASEGLAGEGHPLGLPRGRGEGLGHGALPGVGKVDILPRIVRKVEPRYPVGARKGGLAGSVRVRFVVDARGHVCDPEVLRADPPGVFEESALDAVRKWRFKPAKKDGRVVSIRVVLPIRFSLKP
ncbi:energy transducer TonB [Desulfocurvus sp. DL9XJH121]